MALGANPGRPIRTAPGWAPAVPPFITYPVDNVAWGNMETPPFAPAQFYERGEAPHAAPPPSRAPMAPPAPPAASQTPPARPMIPPTGPLPVEDWFGLLR